MKSRTESVAAPLVLRLTILQTMELRVDGSHLRVNVMEGLSKTRWQQSVSRRRSKARSSLVTASWSLEWLFDHSQIDTACQGRCIQDLSSGIWHTVEQQHRILSDVVCTGDNYRFA